MHLHKKRLMLAHFATMHGGAVRLNVTFSTFVIAYWSVLAAVSASIQLRYRLSIAPACKRGLKFPRVPKCLSQDILIDMEDVETVSGSLPPGAASSGASKDQQQSVAGPEGDPGDAPEAATPAETASAERDAGKEAAGYAQGKSDNLDGAPSVSPCMAERC